MAKFIITKSSKNEQFYFALKAGNGETILQSEGYVSKQGCENGIDSVKRHAPYDSNYEKKGASAGNYYFVLKANNGEPIGRSEMYMSTQGRDNGITSVKNNAPSATIDDQTVSSNSFASWNR